MSQPQKEVSVYIQRKATSGTGKTYYPLVKVKEGQGQRTGSLKPPFFIRVFDAKTKTQRPRRLEAQNFQDAKKEAALGNLALDAQKAGLTVREAEDLNRKLITTAVTAYLNNDINSLGKRRKKDWSEKTRNGYKFVLDEFVGQLPSQAYYIDQVVPMDLFQRYVDWLKQQKAEPKTIENKAGTVTSMLKHAGIVTPSALVTLPPVEEEIAEPYTKEDLAKLFKVMDAEEKVRFTFFLDSACREQEVSHARWDDIVNGKYHVRGKQYRNHAGKQKEFKPKTHEQRLVPLIRELLEALKERERKSKSDWIFPNELGDPDGHFLRKFKIIAKRAGLNCQKCETTITEGKYVKKQVKVTCQTRPVCQKHYLHRLRKTCATFWHQQHIPLRNIQNWLGHKSLSTTQKYLGLTDVEELKDQINTPKY